MSDHGRLRATCLGRLHFPNQAGNFQQIARLDGMLQISLHRYQRHFVFAAATGLLARTCIPGRDPQIGLFDKAKLFSTRAVVA